MRYDTLRINSESKARLTWNSESAPLYVRGDILSKGSIHTTKDIVLHDSKADDNSVVYPGTIRFWGGNFYGFVSEERGWINWTDPVIGLVDKFESLKREVEERELWSPFWAVGDIPGSEPMGWNFHRGRIAIGKPYAGDALFEVGGDVIFDRRLTVRGQIKAESGLRVGDTHVEQPGMIRFREGLFEGYDGIKWNRLLSEECDMRVVKEVEEKREEKHDNVNYASRDYVDRMISIGLIWLPVMNGIITVDILGEEWCGDAGWNVGDRLWFRGRNGDHLGLREILERDETSEGIIYQLGKMREDPMRGVYQPGALYGIIIKEGKEQQTWWIQLREDGRMESGEFVIYPERVVDVERVTVERVVIQDTMRQEFEDWKLQTNFFMDGRFRQIDEVLQTIDERPARIPSGGVNENHIRVGSIRGNHIMNGVILGHHLGEGVIEPRHLSRGCFRLEQLEDGSIQSRHLGKGSITSSVIAPGAIEEYHLYGKMDPRRIFNLATLTDDWFQDQSIDSRVLKDRCIIGSKIQEHVIRVHHLHRDFMLDGGQIRHGTIGTEQLRVGEISGDVLRAGTGRANFFGPGALPGWVLTENTVHANTLIRETLTKNHFIPSQRGFRLDIDSHIWSSDSMSYCELGDTLKLRMNPDIGFWSKVKSPGREWNHVNRIVSDVEVGDREVFDRLWWDEKGYQEEWKEIPERWSHIKLFGMTESRGVWTHKGKLVVRGKVDIPELDIQRRLTDHVYRYALYQSCPIGTIVCWRKDRPIPSGWEEITLESQQKELIWIEKIGVGLIAEETFDIDRTMVEETENEHNDESTEPIL